MPAALATITIDSGTPWEYNAVYETGNPASPVDMSQGWSAQAYFWDANGLIARLTTTAGDDGVINLGADGSIQVDLTVTATARMTSSGEWLLGVEQPNGDIAYLLRGQMVVNQGAPA